MLKNMHNKYFNRPPPFKTMVIAGSHMFHVQNVYLIYIIQWSWLRSPIVVIAMWSLSLTYYETTAVSEV